MSYTAGQLTDGFELLRLTQSRFGCPVFGDFGLQVQIGVIELDRIDDTNELKRRFIETGVFVRPFRNIVYLTPAFTIAPDESERLTTAVRTVVAAL